MLQASFLDCLFLDFLSQFQDFCASAVIHIERRQIVQALVVTMVVVVIDEGFDLPLQITWQVIVLQKNTVLHGLVPALNLALGLGMMRRTSHMIHSLVIEILDQFSGNVGRTVITE